MAEPIPAIRGLVDPLEQAHSFRSRNDWRAIVALGKHLPDVLDSASVPLADAVAFALGRLRRYRSALELIERAWSATPSGRLASAAAYVCYASLLDEAAPRRRERGEPEIVPRQNARSAFRRWNSEALERCPDSIKDLYRLGVFEAQLESRHDKQALHAFAARSAPTTDSSRVRGRAVAISARPGIALSRAAARSALRLGRIPLARRLCFSVLRDDRDHDVEAQHKLSLAGRICLAGGEFDHAERALRRAIDAPGPPRKDWIHGLLATVYLRRGAPVDGLRWIDLHVLPPRRTPAIWRLMGQLHDAAGSTDEAIVALRHALARDKGGRHLTLRTLGGVLERRGELREAERAYRDAIEFRARTWHSDDRESLEGLERVLAARGRSDRLTARLAKADAPRREAAA